MEGVKPVLVPYLERWHLLPDGAAFETHTSHLQPVTWQGQPAMLKVFKAKSDEKASGGILRLFDGCGVVRVFAGDETSVVLERVGPQTVLDVELDDGPAIAVILDVVQRLHGTSVAAAPGAITLRDWFGALFDRQGESALHGRCAAMARDLLAQPRDVMVLHGDIHHANILQSPRGWLAIDPKGLVGERTYDVANLFGNPLHQPEVFLDAQRMRWLARACASRLSLDVTRVLQFAFAFAGLSASWPADEGEVDTEPALRLRSAEIIEEIIRTGV